VDGYKEIPEDTLKFMEVPQWTGTPQGITSNYKSLSGRIQGTPRGYLEIYASPWVDEYIPRDNL